MNAAQQAQADREKLQRRRSRYDHPHISIEQPREQTALQPMPSPQPIANTAQPRQREVITGTSLDRAHAFTVRTGRISTMTAGATAAIWFLVRFALPLTTGGATAGVLIVGAFSILAALFAFLAVWILAYSLDMLMSPGGVDLFESWRTQRRIDAQSAAMVEAYRKAHDISEVTYE